MGWDKIERRNWSTRDTPRARAKLARKYSGPARLLLHVRKDFVNAVSGDDRRRFDCYANKDEHAIRLVPSADGQVMATRTSGKEKFQFKVGRVEWLPDRPTHFIECPEISIVSHDGLDAIEVTLPIGFGSGQDPVKNKSEPDPPKKSEPPPREKPATPPDPPAKKPATSPAKKLATAAAQAAPSGAAHHADLVPAVPRFSGHSGIEVDVATNLVLFGRQKIILTPRTVRMVAALAAVKRGDVLPRGLVAKKIWNRVPASYDTLISQLVSEANFALERIALGVRVVPRIGLSVDSL